jgi:AraC-like DNA-binding protein
MLWGLRGRLEVSGKAHRHDMNELLVALNSSGRQWINGKSFDFQPGRAFMLPGGSSHFIEVPSDGSSEFAFICFDKKYFSDQGKNDIQHLVNELENQQHYSSGDGKIFQEENISLINKAINEFNSPQILSDAIIETILIQMLVNYQRSLNLPSPDQAGNANIKKIHHQILNHPEKTYSLKEVAHQAHMSRTTFSVNFKKYTGTTFIEFVLRARIKKSLDLFYKTELSVSETALECGFNNLAHFHRVFKERFGKTPLAMKKIIKSQGPFPYILKILD